MHRRNATKNKFCFFKWNNFRTGGYSFIDFSKNGKKARTIMEIKYKISLHPSDTNLILNIYENKTHSEHKSSDEHRWNGNESETKISQVFFELQLSNLHFPRHLFVFIIFHEKSFLVKYLIYYFHRFCIRISSFFFLFWNWEFTWNLKNHEH